MIGGDTRSDRDALWREALLDAEAQALEDLAGTLGAEVVLLQYPSATVGGAHLDAAARRSAAAGFVTARVRLVESRSFDALDILVRAIATELTPPEHVPARGRFDVPAARRGVIALLEAFQARTGTGALSALDLACLSEGIGGDLALLARAFLAAPRKPRAEARRIEAWLAGTNLSRAEDGPVALSALTARTARRCLGEMTQLVRLLGWRGTHVLLDGADVLARLPPARRDDAYTVLREVVDNIEAGRGLVATRIVLAGGPALFEGVTSLHALKPLAMRVAPPPDAPPDAPPPHRTTLDLAPPTAWRAQWPRRAGAVARTAAMWHPALRALVRASQGLPPVDALASLSVGHERIDEAITRLFDHAAMGSSVFALLVGAYGTGKTHLLLHLTARALTDRRPVLRLSLERADNDLGAPQRHLRRMLEQATVPVAGYPSPLDRLAAWTRAPALFERLVKSIDQIAAEGGEVSPVALRLQTQMRRARAPGQAAESFLGGLDLVEKSSAPNYRSDAYQRLLLWIALLGRMEGCQGPVVIIDEAENLYRGGTTRAMRRTALRSLSFYCGAALPGACVVMAVTPDVLDDLRAEAADLLDDVAEQRTLLACEDAAMLRRRLTALRPLQVPALEPGHRAALATRVREAHGRVRGGLDDPGWDAYISALVASEVPPRELVRRVTDRLERIWWHGG